MLWPVIALEDAWCLSLRRFLPLVGDIRDVNDGDDDSGDARTFARPEAGKSARALPFDFIETATTRVDERRGVLLVTDYIEAKS